ncbi:MAG: 1-deoxy-D-xylulose-5-phosphate reductoisomerase, partial [Clostridium sp.]|nr:1-deoxy-D-xylulose-5-phosphate reductoisomerase [Clostridium sp.]
EIDIVVTSVVGMIGLEPTMKAIEAKKDIALANKETLVVAGEIVMKAAKENNVRILPVDSEHSAIEQSLQGNKLDTLKKIILTASGGPFRGKTTEELKTMGVQDALKHPKWNMGRKISIDSATLMNKGLEVIEAHWLFNCDYDNIQVLVHPQSIIHSMVEYVDGSIIAQLGAQDMRLPIQYALNYEERKELVSNTIDFYEIAQLTFEKPDMDTFRCLKLAFEAGRKGGLMPTILNGANEAAVELFLDEKISFLKIPQLIEEAMRNFEEDGRRELTLENIIDLDRRVKAYVKENAN